jgi:hypothetical protein
METTVIGFVPWHSVHEWVRNECRSLALDFCHFGVTTSIIRMVIGGSAYLIGQKEGEIHHSMDQEASSA